MMREGGQENRREGKQVDWGPSKGWTGHGEGALGWRTEGAREGVREEGT